MVFIHGFNVSFDNAIKRAGQIAYDLNFDGPVFLFTWPSRGGDTLLSHVLRVFDYRYDRVSAEIAGAHLEQFLDQIIVQTNFTKVHFIAHSMGNKALLDALRLSANAHSLTQVRLGEIILAAPDVERDSFIQLIGSLGNLVSKITLYASGSDRALLASRWFWQGAPAGFVVKGQGPIVLDGVETINITAAGDSLLGLNHDIYASNPDISKDMSSILERNLHPPDVRSRSFLREATTEGIYWLYRRSVP
jgi:esterase/lipase superfamily enzyme